MCELLQAEEFLKIYNYDMDQAKEDGAEREFLEAEAVLESDRIENYDNMMSLSFR